MRWATLCVLAAVAGKASLGSPWICVSSPSLEIFTDSGEKNARVVLNRFEVLHRVFGASYQAYSPSRLRVFLFSSQQDFAKYRSNAVGDAFYQHSEDGESIILNLQTSLQRVASHEYMHMVIHHAPLILPHWFEEGLAEFYSNVSVKGSKVFIGERLPPHLDLLSKERWLSAEDLALGSPLDGRIFYAESWALVHMLSLGPEWRDGMLKFVDLLSQGRGQHEAFEEAFGKSLDDAIPALRGYLLNMKETTAPAPPPDSIETYEVSHLAALDATVMLAELALHTEQPALARSLFLKAAAEGPESPAGAASLGQLALAEDRMDDAEREFERAAAMGSRDASIYFQLAMLKNDDALLEKALAIDPHMSEAHFLLGVHATDNGSFPSAIGHLRQAIAIEPRRFSYWHALGYAQAKSGDRQGAAESARRAAVIAVTAPEEKMAAALTQLAAAGLPTVATKRPDVITPPSWQNRKGDARAEGMLTEVDCNSLPVRLVFSTTTPDKTIELIVSIPTAVVLLNAEGISTTLDCGKQSRPVSIEYIAATREITRIEFKNVIMKP